MPLKLLLKLVKREAKIEGLARAMKAVREARKLLKQRMTAVREAGREKGFSDWKGVTTLLINIGVMMIMLGFAYAIVTQTTNGSPWAVNTFSQIGTWVPFIVAAAVVGIIVKMFRE